MVTPSSPTVLRWYVASELARLRAGAGLTLKQVGERLGCSTSHVGHLETGRSLPAQPELEVLLEFYGVGERIPAFAELLTAARRTKDWWLPFSGAAPAWFDLFLGLESAATQIESYDAQVIPGLFQTPDYMNAVIRAGAPELPESEINRRIELRLARQDQLSRQDEPPAIWSILDESVLHGTTEKPQLMRTQLEHLLKRAELPHVTILALPLSVRPHAGMDGTFKILSFPQLAGAPAVAYTDGRIQGSYYDRPDAVLHYRNALTRLHNLALSPEQSRAMIEYRLRDLT